MAECGWFGQVRALSIGRVGLVRHQTSDSTHYPKATGRRLWLARWLRIKDGDGHGMGGDEWEETESGWGVYPCTTYKRGRRAGVVWRLGWRVPSRHLGGRGMLFVCGFDFWLCFLGFGRQRRCDEKGHRQWKPQRSITGLTAFPTPSLPLSFSSPTSKHRSPSTA